MAARQRLRGGKACDWLGGAWRRRAAEPRGSSAIGSGDGGGGSGAWPARWRGPPHGAGGGASGGGALLRCLATRQWGSRRGALVARWAARHTRWGKEAR